MHVSKTSIFIAFAPVAAVLLLALLRLFKRSITSRQLQLPGKLPIVAASLHKPQHAQQAYYKPAASHQVSHALTLLGIGMHRALVQAYRLKASATGKACRYFLHLPQSRYKHAAFATFLQISHTPHQSAFHLTGRCDTAYICKTRPSSTRHWPSKYFGSSSCFTSVHCSKQGRESKDPDEACALHKALFCAANGVGHYPRRPAQNQTWV